MIDLTPLDVRNKRGDFRRMLRGYDPEEVDAFLELVAERLEELVKENLTLAERTERLKEQVDSSLGREKAVQEALVSAQELRDEIRSQAQKESEELRTQAQDMADELRAQAQREAELMRKEAEARARDIVGEAERQLVERGEALKEMERKRVRFLKAFRSLLERELDMVEVEEGRTPLDDDTVDLELKGGPRSDTPEEGGGVVLEFARSASPEADEPEPVEPEPVEAQEPQVAAPEEEDPPLPPGRAATMVHLGGPPEDVPTSDAALDDTPEEAPKETPEGARSEDVPESETRGSEADDLWLSLMKKRPSEETDGGSEWS